MQWLGIQPRLLAAILLAVLVPLLLLQLTLTQRFTDELRTRISANLASIADHKLDQIQVILQHQLDEAAALASLPATLQALREAAAIERQGGPLAARLRPVHEAYAHNLGALLQQSNFAHLLLFNRQGDVVYSSRAATDVGSNIFSGAERHTPLAYDVQQSLLAQEGRVGDFAWDFTEQSQQAWVSVPVRSDDRVLGVLVVRLSFAAIAQVLQERQGLGQSGVVMLAQRTGQPARILTTLGDKSGASPQFGDHYAQLVLHQSQPLMQALAGLSGQGESLDLRQVPVLAAWHYLPKARWGLVVKIDQAEAYAPVVSLQRFSLLLLLMAATLAIALAVSLGRSIVRPLRELTGAVSAMTAGHWHSQVQVTQQDEVGELAAAFNHMSERLVAAQAAVAQAQGSLAQQVEQRTEALQWQEAQTRTILDNVHDGVIACGDHGRINSFNAAAARMFGYGVAEVIGRPIGELIPALSTLATPQHEAPPALLHNQEVTALHRDGSRLPLRLRLSQTHHGARHLWVISAQDVREIHEVEQRRQLYASVFENSGEAILISDADNRILAVNHAFSTLTGYGIEDIRGRNPRLLASGKTSRQTYQDMWANLNRQGFWQGETWNRTKDGRVYPNWMTVSVVRDQEERLTHYIVSYLDITERKAAEERINHLAHHDALTGLLNRLSLVNRLEQALATARREQRQLALMFLDMDRFKAINDTLGHAAGDSLLVEVARRLSEVVRASDIVARFGGDEFVVVLSEVDDAGSVARVADKVLRSLARPYVLAGQEARSSPSVGVALFPGDGKDGESLLKHADTAMYHAKSQGRNRVQFFAAEMNHAANTRLRLEHQLRNALQQGQFVLHYQPRLDGHSGHFVNVEALLRWQHPDDGLRTPDSFLEVAEECGLLLELGAWVIDEACRQLADWRSQGLLGLGMTVNISARQFHSPTLPRSLTETLEKHGLAAHDLELDISEAILMDNPEVAIAKLHELRASGVRLSIGNFGTGYSSLHHLQQMPIDNLKIDHSLVRGLATDNQHTLCNATIALAHSLGLRVVAEGVETEDQRQVLFQQRCDYMQGYLFGRPASAGQTAEALQRVLH